MACTSLKQYTESNLAAEIRLYHIIIISYHIVDLKRQNRLKVGTNKPKLKVETESVSYDDVRKK